VSKEGIPPKTVPHLSTLQLRDIFFNAGPGTEKNELKPWLKEQYCIPPEANAAFVCQMEEGVKIVEIYVVADPEHLRQLDLVILDSGVERAP
jgi:hypothetical protein